MQIAFGVVQIDFSRMQNKFSLMQIILGALKEIKNYGKET